MRRPSRLAVLLLVGTAPVACVDHTLHGRPGGESTSRASSGSTSRPASRPAERDIGQELLQSHGGEGAKKILEARGAMPDWSDYDALLRKAVRGLTVDYAVVRENVTVIDQLLGAIAKTDLDKLDPEAKLTVCINAYNAATLKLVLAHVLDRGEGMAPLAGVLEVKKNGGIDFFDSKQVLFGGRMLSLNELEKWGRDLGDPRIHFAVNCASVSCPPLLPRAWRVATLEGDLDAATKAYLRNPEGLRIRDGQVFVSKIFEWYAADWGGAEGVKNFLRLHGDDRTKEYLDRDLGYLEYDWKLNATR